MGFALGGHDFFTENSVLFCDTQKLTSVVDYNLSNSTNRKGKLTDLCYNPLQITEKEQSQRSNFMYIRPPDVGFRFTWLFRIYFFEYLFEELVRVVPDPEEVFISSQKTRLREGINISIHVSFFHPRRQCFCAETN